jgi:fluoride exporter
VESSLLVPDGEEVDGGRGRGGSLRFDRREIAAIFVGGFAGAVARAELLEALPYRVGSWPWATFIVNVAGAFLLGYFATRLQERLPVSAYRRPLLGTGLCGALTTFSTMQVELLRMLDTDHVGLALAYALASVAAGFLAVVLATNLVRRARLSG